MNHLTPLALGRFLAAEIQARVRGIREDADDGGLWYQIVEEPEVFRD
jgi:hypothetical protein